MSVLLKFVVCVLFIYSVLPASEVQAGGKVYYEPPVVQKVEGNSLMTEPDLIFFQLTTTKWKADYSHLYGPNAHNWGTTMVAEFKTNKMEDLEKYVIVQFMKGCVFFEKYENGVLSQYGGVDRNFFGTKVDYHFTDWVIDSDDEDPVYNSPYASELAKMKKPSRQGIYRWNSIPGSVDQKTEFYYGFQNPPTEPRLYVFDRPGTAWVESNIARNVSLEFETCIYRTADVPTVWATPSDKGFAKPVTCLSWDSSYVYDWVSAEYKRPAGIHPYCLTK